MKTSLSPSDIGPYVWRQATVLFPDDLSCPVELPQVIGRALERTEYCLANTNFPHCRDGEATYFNHRNTDVYAIFLYYLANTAAKEFGLTGLADRLYALNKALHSLDLYHQVVMPDIFMLVHPVGTVIGRGTFANYFCVYQNCTVGSNLNGEYPVFGPGVIMYGGSRVIGRSRIGSNSQVAAGSSVMDFVAPPDSIVYGTHPDVTVKRNRRDVRQVAFGITDQALQ